MRVTVLLCFLVSACVSACVVPPPDPQPPEVPPPNTQQEIELCSADQVPPDDPGATIDGWTTVGGALIEYNGIGALFLSEAVCNGDAQMAKTVDMPECFMPLALELESNIVSGEYYSPLDATGVMLGGAPLDFGFSEYETRRCIGARSFGGPRELLIKPRTAYSLCEVAIGEVAHVALVEEPTCPSPGETTPYEDWTLYGQETFSRAEVVGGNLELQITPGSCADARADGPVVGAISLPDEVGIGVSIVVEGDGNFGPEDGYDGGLYMRLGRVVTKLALGENRICLPRALRGTTNRMGFYLTHESCSSSSAPGRFAVVHPPEIVTDCPDSDAPGGDLESAGPWRVQPSYGLETAFIANGVATLEASKQCDVPNLFGTISVPLPENGAGAALRVHYSASGPGTSAIYVGEAGLYSQMPIDGDVATLCLGSSRVGELMDVSVNATTETGGSGACAEVVPVPTRVEIDTVEVLLDPACAE